MSEEQPTRSEINAVAVHQLSESKLFNTTSVLAPVVVVLFTAVVACFFGYKYGELHGEETGRLTEKCSIQGGAYNADTAICVKFVNLKSSDGGAP
jgi:hypothetical protein